MKLGFSKDIQNTAHITLNTLTEKTKMSWRFRNELCRVSMCFQYQPLMEKN